jgi:hypothetical protein
MVQEATMKAITCALLITGVALTGCAGPSTITETTGKTAGPGTVAAAEASDLTGTWHGLYAWPGGTYWSDDATGTLQINPDGTFTARVIPSPGANNLAKASTWSGTVEVTRNRMVLRSSKGSSVSLTRKGDRLYGIAQDPIVEVPVTISLQRDRTVTAAASTELGTVESARR